MECQQDFIEINFLEKPKYASHSKAATEQTRGGHDSA